MTKKIIAILMAMALVLSFAACGAKEEPATEPAESETAAESTSAPEETSAPAEETSIEETSAEETTAEETTAAAAKAPETTEEIVEYFNTAVNKVKTDAKSVTRSYSKITLSGETKFPGIIDTAMKIVGGADEFISDQLAKQSKGSETYNGKAAIQGVFPVENETWASKLTAADVKSATCTEKDGKYTVTVVTIADGKSSSVQHGQGHAPKAFNVVLPGVVNDNVPKAAASLIGGEAQLNYPSCKAVIVVDAATGNVISADYYLYWTINFGDNIVLPFLTNDYFTINF